MDRTREKVPRKAPRNELLRSTQKGRSFLEKDCCGTKKKKEKKVETTNTPDPKGGSLDDSASVAQTSTQASVMRGGYVDTPMKRAVRELHTHWQPIFGGAQETPPFREMAHAAFNYDDTQFSSSEYYSPIPKWSPTGHGALHPKEPRQTGHFLGKLLEQASPNLATLYRGGAPNEHTDRVEQGIYTNFQTRDYLGRAVQAESKFTNRVLSGPRKSSRTR